MNRNSNRKTRITLTDGTSQVISFRNSFGGWLNALERAGIDPDDVESSESVLTDEDRIA